MNLIWALFEIIYPFSLNPVIITDNPIFIVASFFNGLFY